MDKRGTVSARRSPGRFRCLPCKRIVTGTEAGHCPNCGFVPPSAPEVPREVTPVLSWILIGFAIALMAAYFVVFVIN